MKRNNTLLVFATDNGPYGEPAREFGNQGTPDMGNSGPFRRELGEVTEGSIRTFCFVRWPGKVTDLYPFASLAWTKGNDNWMTYLTGDIPVGAYQSSRS